MKHNTPVIRGPRVSGDSANESTGDTTQIRGTKKPTHARTNRPVSRRVLWLLATLTLRLRRPCGARMASIVKVAASITAFAIHGFMAIPYTSPIENDVANWLVRLSTVRMSRARWRHDGT